MMTAYILRLLLLVPLVGGLAFASIWLWRRLQPGMAVARGARAVRIVDGVPLGATGRLAVVEFGGRHLLVAMSRGQVTLLGETPAPDPDGLAEQPPPARPFPAFPDLKRR